MGGKREGKIDQAVKMMRSAAEGEEKLGKHPVSPGAIAPIYEQLGDLLVETKRPAPELAEAKTFFAKK